MIISSQIKAKFSEICDLEGLLKLLQIKNPEYEATKRFSRFPTRKPEFLYFYKQDAYTKSIIIPRNIPKKYFEQNIVVENIKSFGKSKIKTIFTSPAFTHEQQKIIDKYNNKLLNTDILVLAPCGSGKTLLGLSFIVTKKVNAIVVVTTIVQANNYISEAKKFFPGLTIDIYNPKKGIINDVTIATYSLLSNTKKYNEEFYSQFGHVVFDEFHRIGAITYRNIAEQAVCFYRTSLTATFRRGDHLESILQYHAGDIISWDGSWDNALILPMFTKIDFSIKDYMSYENRAVKFEVLKKGSEYLVKLRNNKKITQKIKIRDINKVVKAVVDVSGLVIRYSDYKFYKQSFVSIPNVITALSEHPVRNKLIVDLLNKLYNLNRTVLVLASRKKLLFDLYAHFSKLNINNLIAGVLVSNKDPKVLKDISKLNGYEDILKYEEAVINNAKIIFGIDKLAQEGLNVPRCDTLVIATPLRDIEQAVGRILRKSPNKEYPIVYYLIDDIFVCRRYFYSDDGARKQIINLGHILYEEQILKNYIYGSHIN